MPSRRTTRGDLVAVSSIAELRGDWHQFACNATGAAVNGFVRSLGLGGARVNAVAPASTVSLLTQPEDNAHLAPPRDTKEHPA
ncbi:hypothetical protein [Streptomyces sp. NPDC051016]|uniref:hypothetical protein n=1 Tax=Streptomyces sp. NPDC051016 TaxID=3365638 RepID=UPI00378BCD1F